MSANGGSRSGRIAHRGVVLMLLVLGLSVAPALTAPPPRRAIPEQAAAARAVRSR